MCPRASAARGRGHRAAPAAEPGSDHQLAWAQLLGWTAVTPDQLDFVAGLLDGSAEVPGLAVDTELRWPLLRRLAATGRAGDAEIDAELARDATDAGRGIAAACRARDPRRRAQGRGVAAGGRVDDLGLEDVDRGRPGRSTSPSTRSCSRRTQRSTSPSCRRSGRRAPDGSGCCSARELFPYPAASPELLGPDRGVPGRRGPRPGAGAGGHRGPRHGREGAAVAGATVLARPALSRAARGAAGRFLSAARVTFLARLEVL